MDPITYLHAQQISGPLLILARDSDLQRAIAAWPSLVFHMPARASPEGFSTPQDAIEAAWDGVVTDRDVLATVFGTAVLGERLVRQAARLGLAFPDGSVHRSAQTVIAKLVRDALAPAGDRGRQPKGRQP